MYKFRYKMVFVCNEYEYITDITARRRFIQLKEEIIQLFNNEPFHIGWEVDPSVRTPGWILRSTNLVLASDNEELMAIVKLKYGNLELR